MAAAAVFSARFSSLRRFLFRQAIVQALQMLLPEEQEAGALLLSAPICAESLELLRDEYREARKLQEVIDLALHGLREEPEILGEIIRTLNLCWQPVS